MCCKNFKLVISDLFSSVKNNVSHFGINKYFLLPYGIFRIVIICLLTLGWICAALIPASNQFYYIDNDYYWPGNGIFRNNPAIQPSQVYENVQIRAAYLAVCLIAWFFSLVILIVGILNIINFPYFSDKFSLFQFFISDLIFSLGMFIVSLLAINTENNIKKYWYGTFYRQYCFYIAGAAGLAAFIMYMVSIVWSIVELYKIRKASVKAKIQKQNEEKQIEKEENAGVEA